MKRVFVAGPFSAKTTMQVVANVRAGQRAAAEVLLAGFAPYWGWSDFYLQMMLREDETATLDQCYAYTLAFVEACHAVLALPGWDGSIGARAEVGKAIELGIPVVFSVEELKNLFG